MSATMLTAAPKDLAHIRRPARMEHLPDLLQACEQACDAADSGPEDRHALHLALEEVCVNVITHGYRDLPTGPLELHFEFLPPPEGGSAALRVTVQDEGRTFIPQDAPPPDLASDWDDRRIGGLGWHLVGQMVDELRHDTPESGGNRLTLLRRLRSLPHP